MSTFETILPSSATAIERALERVLSFPDLPIDELGDLTNPAKIREALLPFLAYRFSTDIWLDEWGPEKRRSVVAQQFDIHRTKGTLGGIKRMLALVDAELVQAITPPRRAFASGKISKEQRDAWLAKMPQLRIYLVSEKGLAKADAFAGADGRGHGAFVGHAFARFDAGAAIYGRRATLHLPDGTETNIRRSEVEKELVTVQTRQYDRMHIPGERACALYVSGFLKTKFVTLKNKQAQIITVSLDREYRSQESSLHLSTVKPGLNPVDPKYERGSDTGLAGARQFAGRFAKKFAVRDDAELHLFDRVYLHDDTVDAPWVRAHTFANHTLVGMKPHRADLLIEKQGFASKRIGFAGSGFVGRSFARQENQNQTKLVYSAVRNAKAARDRIRVSTHCYDKYPFGDGIAFDGKFHFGVKFRRLT